MTPEERFNRIENLLHAITELQARHDEASVRHNEATAWHDEAIARHDEAFARHDEAADRIDAQLEKQNAGIQDLIRISGALIDSQTKTWDVVRIMSDRIDKLSENIDRFLKGLQKPNGNH